MAVANLADGFYSLHVKTTPSGQFAKIDHLQKCDPPTEEKVRDEVTATDDTQKIEVTVNFKEFSEIEFEYVLDSKNATHTALQKAYDDDAEVEFQFKFTHVPSENRQFKGKISKLTVDGDDPKKKLRKKGTITITGDVTKIVA